MKVTSHSSRDGTERFTLDNKIIYEYGNEFGISYAVYELLRNAELTNADVTAKEIAERI